MQSSTRAETAVSRQPSDVISGLILAACADALSRHGHEAVSNGLAGHTGHKLQHGHHGIGGDSGGAQGGNRALYHQLAQLEHAVFYPRRKADTQYPEDHLRLRAKGSELADPHRGIGAVKGDKHGTCGKGIGHSRGNGGSGYPHVQTKHQNSVARDIQQVPTYGDHHGETGASRGAVDGGGGIEHRKERVGEGGDEKVDLRRLHHSGLYRSENQPEKRFPQSQA